MRILQVAHYFLPRHLGGVENYTYNLAKELQKQHEVYVYCREDGYFNKDYYEVNEIYEGLFLKRIFYNKRRTLEDTYNNRLIDERFADFLDRLKPEVIHFQHLERLSVGMINMARKKGIPSVLTLHDYWFICPLIQLLIQYETPCPLEYSPERCLNCINTWAQRNQVVFYPKQDANTMLNIVNRRKEVMREVLNKVDAIIAPSLFLKKKHLESGLTSNIEYFDYGINLKEFSVLNRSHERGISFGFIGSIMKHKGLHILVDAFKRLKSSDVKLKIFGKGYDTYFAGVIKSSMKDERIEYKGHFRNSKLTEILSQIDILVVPSLWYENSPFVIHEAFAARIPVIASDIGGISEKVHDGKNGLLFDPHKENDLFEKLSLIEQNRHWIGKMSYNIRPIKSIEQNASELTGIYGTSMINGK
ncbi:MAG: glycosyltransferase family 4 protein [Candidatus Omnitrophota bacterium]|jgi:glycosyltransferase involved in cell wall biosynthesis